MRQRRLDRLAKLTQGAALVSLSSLTALAGCHGDSIGNPEPVHTNSPAPPTINATATPTPSVVPADSSAPLASTSATPSASERMHVPIGVNAPPQTPLPKPSHPTAPVYTNSPPPGSK